jgi:hypothetical protein
MKRVEFTLNIGFSGAECIEVMEYDDDVTQEEIDQDWQEWIWNHIDGGPRVMEDDE